MMNQSKYWYLKIHLEAIMKKEHIFIILLSARRCQRKFNNKFEIFNLCQLGGGVTTGSLKNVSYFVQPFNLL